MFKEAVLAIGLFALCAFGAAERMSADDPVEVATEVAEATSAPESPGRCALD